MLVPLFFGAEIAITHGWLGAIPFLLLTVLFPLTLLLAIAREPRRIELNKNLKTITLAFKGFGRVRRVVHHSKDYRLVYSRVRGFRAPCIQVVLRPFDLAADEVIIASTFDFAYEVSHGLPSKAVVPAEFVKLRAALENDFGIVDIGHEPDVITTSRNN